MRVLRVPVLIIICVCLALLARSSSMGAALNSVVRGYLSAITSSRGQDAIGFLTDSLAGKVSSEFIQGLAESPDSGNLQVGRTENRGLAVSLNLDGGGSRTFWLLKTHEGEWVISGDSSLDNLLATASMKCLSYARESVIPAVSAGTDPSSFVCPVTGEPYEVDESVLLCPAGHLGLGLYFDDTACAAARESVVEEISAYIAEGYPFPESLTQMYEQSGGAFGLRGGYRCPDDGYSYFEIKFDDQAEYEGVYCPYHDRTTPFQHADSTASAARIAG